MNGRLQAYLNLVRKNHNFRRLWLSQIVSNFGDWFGLLAVYALITKYSGSELLLGLIIVVKMVSLAAFSPIAGYLADRFDRRKLMIMCDVVRGLLMLGFLFIHSYEQLWLAYVLTTLQMMLSALFEPAKTSSIPNITTHDELVSANILSSISWSIIFTLGMGIGGLATGFLGTSLVFLIDAVSYGLSAWWISQAAIPSPSDKEMQQHARPIRGIIDGFKFLHTNGQVLRPTLAKGAFTLFQGALVYMLILVSDNILMMGSIGLGLLYAARGLGTAVGPILARRWIPDVQHWIKAMGLFMMAGGLSYMLVGFTSDLGLMMLLVFLAHTASGANWVMSTVLLQRRAPDYYRGRVFSTEWLLFTIGQSVSVMICSFLLDEGWLQLHWAIAMFALLLAFVGVVWTFFITPAEIRYHRKGAVLKRR